MVPANTVTSRKLATIDEIAQDLANTLSQILTREMQDCLGCTNPPVTLSLTVTHISTNTRKLQEAYVEVIKSIRDNSTTHRRDQTSPDVTLNFRVEGTGTGGNCAYASSDQQAQMHMNDSLQKILKDNQALANQLRNNGTTPTLGSVKSVATEYPLQSSCSDNPQNAFVIEFGQRKDCAWLSCDSRFQLKYCQKPYYVTSICPGTCSGRCANFQTASCNSSS